VNQNGAAFANFFNLHICTVSLKNMTLNFCRNIYQILTDFENLFTGTSCGQFAVKMWWDV